MYFSILRTAEFQKRIEERLTELRKKEFGTKLAMLIPQESKKTTGEKRKGNKVDMLGHLLGHCHPINTGRMSPI